MSETSWQRLARLIKARAEHLGITQSEIEARGGPSTAWVRKLRALSGPPSGRQGKMLRKVSTELGWPESTAWSLVAEDRTDWSEDMLASEDHDLIYGRAPVTVAEPEPVSLVRRLTDLFRTDDMAGVTEDEWADLLAAIEAKMPKPAARGKRPQRKTGT